MGEQQAPVRVAMERRNRDLDPQLVWRGKEAQDESDLIVQAAAEENPMGRNATPADVVPAMAFLLSDEAGFITGVTLPVTGGSAIV